VALAQQNETEARQTAPGEHRVFTRVPFDHSVRWEGGHGDRGRASARNVSRTGIALSSGRFLRPGPVVRFVFDDIAYNGAPIEVHAITVWCRPVPDAPGTFAAGFSVVQGERHTLAAMSEVFYAAIRQYTALHHLH
jgi:hypothetical protein